MKGPAGESRGGLPFTEIEVGLLGQGCSLDNGAIMEHELSCRRRGRRATYCLSSLPDSRDPELLEGYSSWLVTGIGHWTFVGWLAELGGGFTSIKALRSITGREFEYSISRAFEYRELLENDLPPSVRLTLPSSIHLEAQVR